MHCVMPDFQFIFSYMVRMYCMNDVMLNNQNSKVLWNEMINLAVHLPNWN